MSEESELKADVIADTQVITDLSQSQTDHWMGENDYLKWLDYRIELAQKWIDRQASPVSYEAGYYQAMFNEYRDAKTKFLQTFRKPKEK